MGSGAIVTPYGMDAKTQKRVDGERVQLVKVREDGLPALLIQVRVPPGVMALSLPQMEARVEQLLMAALDKVFKMRAAEILG